MLLFRLPGYVLKRSIIDFLKCAQAVLAAAAEKNSASEPQEALSEKREEDEMKPLASPDSSSRSSREGSFLSDSEQRKYVFPIATLATSVTYNRKGLSSHNDGAYLRRYRALFYCFTCTALVASIFTFSSLRWWLWTLGMSCAMGALGAARSNCICTRLATSALFSSRDGGKKKVTADRVPALPILDAELDLEYLPKLRGHQQIERFMVSLLCCFCGMVDLVVLRLQRYFGVSLRMCTSVALIELTSALAIRRSTSLTTRVFFSALMVASLLCVGLQVLASLVSSDPQGTTDDDADNNRHRHTHKAGIKRKQLGDPIARSPRTYQASFYSSVAILLMVLISTICRTLVLQVAMALDFLVRLIGAYAAGRSCRILSLLIYTVPRQKGTWNGSSQSQGFSGRLFDSEPAAVDKDDDPNHTPMMKPRNNPRNNEATWRVACAAPHHMTGNKSLLQPGSYVPMDDDDVPVVVHYSAGNGEVPLRVRGSGSVRTTEGIALDDVWYVPGLDSNLVSTGQLARQGCAVTLGPGGCRITRGDAVVGTARITEECQFELDFLKV